MKLKRFLAVLTAFALVFTAAPTIAGAEDGTATTSSVYKASDAWSETQNGNDYWSWECSNVDTKGIFVKLTKYHSDGSDIYGADPVNNQATEENRNKTGYGWKDGTAWNNAGVGQYWMRPLIKNSGVSSEYIKNSKVARTFTSPKSGKVTLSTENGKIYGGAANSGNKTAYIKITRNGQQIWPAGGKEFPIPYNQAYFQPCDFSPITVNVYKGDKLRFEVYNGDGDAGYGKWVYWAPVVTYDGETADSNMTYDSLDAWPADGFTKDKLKNDDPVWQFLYRNMTTSGGNQTEAVAESLDQYKAYTVAGVGNGNSTDFAVPTKNEDGTYNYEAAGDNQIVYSDGASSHGMRNAMGKYWIRPSVAGSSDPKQSVNNRIVKAFTAPRSGNVSLSAKDMSGDAKIYNTGLSSGNSKGAVVKVSKVSADGTKTELWKHTFAYTSSSIESVDFDNISLFVNKGEQIWFEVSGETGGSAWAKQVFWNPTVSYYDTQNTAVRIYKATDAWSTDANNKYNGHNEWKWQQLDIKAGVNTFADMNELANVDWMAYEEVPSAKNPGSGPAWRQADGKAAAGKSWMIVRAGSAVGQAVARSFTAPFDGTVVLSAENTDDKGIVYAYGGSPQPTNAANIPPYLKITKNDVQVWPKGDAQYTPSDTTANLQTAPISPVAVTVNKGDVIRFVAYSNDSNINWNRRVYWRPTVEYITPIVNETDPIYCSANGTATATGRENDPYTFAKAIENVKDGGIIIVDGKITLDSSFEWAASDKSFTVKGKDNSSEIDISAFSGSWWNINSDVTFDGIKISGTTNSKIATNGHHVVIKDNVTTSAVFDSIIGGSFKKAVNSTNLEVNGGNYTKIYGGGIADSGVVADVNGDCLLTVGGKVNSDLDDTKWDENNTRKASIHGGGWGGTVYGNSVLTLKGNAKAKYVYGGQDGTITCANRGTVTVSVEGGSFMNVFAIFKNTENNNGNASNRAGTKAVLNMTGGKAEALIGAQHSVIGDIVINANGGTVTRRIIAGTYNDLGKDSKSANHVTGTVTAVIGGGLDGFTDKQLGKGINGGSRTAENPADETGTIIFTDGSYDKFDKLGVFDLNELGYCGNNYDYLVKASANGNVVPKSAGTVTVTSKDSYFASADGTDIADGDYTLKKGVNVIEFAADSGATRISSVTLDGAKATVAYKGASAGSKLIAAVYDTNGDLIDVAYIDAEKGDAQTSEVTLKNAPTSGNTVTVMLWNDLEHMTPICKGFSVQAK